MQKITLQEETLDFRTREAFNTLRTNIEFSGSNIQVVALTSCMHAEGKSTVSYQLARALAMNGRKTLMIDADLRRSVMKKNYKSGKVRLGLTHYLIGRNPYEDVICETDVKDLHMIFAGPVPPNPSELLGNEYFARLLEAARKDYDCVIVDTPPLGAVIDSVVVGRQCDGVAVVVQSGETSYRFVRKIIKQLEMADCKILGCILNKVNTKNHGYYGKYYDKHYGYYEEV